MSYSANRFGRGLSIKHGFSHLGLAAIVQQEREFSALVQAYLDATAVPVFPTPERTHAWVDGRYVQHTAPVSIKVKRPRWSTGTVRRVQISYAV